MQINTTIWGDDTQRHTFNADDTPSRGLCKYSTVIPTLKDYSTAKTMAEPIDESVNLWQVGDNSDINSCLYLRRDGNDNLVQDICRAPMAHSIMLLAPCYNMSNNSKFNLNAGVNSVCQIWSDDSICNFPYKSGANRNDYVVTDFDYNRIAARYQLFVQKHDSSNNRLGSETQVSIYQYWFDVDGNGDSYKDNYYINAMTVQLCIGTTTERYTAFGGSYNYPPSIVCNSQYATPMPNYFYNDAYFYSYTVGNTSNNIFFGLRQISYNTPYQQGAYATSNNAYGGMFWGSNWVIDDYYIGTSHYLSGRFTGTYEDMLKQCAFLGFWFDETQLPNTGGNFTIGTACSDNHVILPEIKDGRTTGNYKRGVLAGADEQATWGSDWRDNVGYTGGQPYRQGGDTGDLSTVFNRLALANNLSYYTADSLAIKQLISNLNTGYQPATQDQFILDFKGTNPADYISSVIFYPANFNCPYTASSFTSIKIGAVTMTFPLGLNEADYNAGYYKEYSPITVPYYFNDFRDYAPYTVISLYVPFCGTVDLDPALFIGHTVTVRLLIDYLTGNCTGVIMRDNTAIDTISGSIGVSIPLTALANGSYQNAIKSAEIALKQAELQRKSAWLAAAGAVGAAVTGIASGNPLAIAGGIAGVVGAANAIESANLRKELAEYNIDHIAPSVDSVSAASPCNALGLDYDIHMLIRRCVSAEGETNGYDSGAYAATIGNACCISDVLGNFSGLTVCSNVKLDNVVSDVIQIGTDTFGGNAATAEEIELIRQALGNGVYM